MYISDYQFTSILKIEPDTSLNTIRMPEKMMQLSGIEHIPRCAEPNQTNRTQTLKSSTVSNRYIMPQLTELQGHRCVRQCIQWADMRRRAQGRQSWWSRLTAKPLAGCEFSNWPEGKSESATSLRSGHRQLTKTMCKGSPTDGKSRDC